MGVAAAGGSGSFEMGMGGVVQGRKDPNESTQRFGLGFGQSSALQLFQCHHNVYILDLNIHQWSDFTVTDQVGHVREL